MAGPASVSSTDTERVARAIFKHSRTDLLDAQNGIMAVLEDTMKDTLVPNGPLASLVRHIVK